MFIDWLAISQEHDHDLPRVGDLLTLKIDLETGDVLTSSQPRFQHEGSFSTSVTIHVQGRTVRMEGNPSRYNRLDNLEGFKTIEQCVFVFNQILAEYGLPAFTKCTYRTVRAGQSGSKPSDWVTDGARIHRLDLTTNFSVGQGNVDAYLRGVSTQRIGRNVGYLYPNGKTVAWTPSGGGKGGRLQYRKCYDKANELQRNLLPRILRRFGEETTEYKYVTDLHKFVEKLGIVRFEQELKSEFLYREHLCHWGLFDESRFSELHKEFLSVDSKLQVTSMDYMTIAQLLKDKDIVKSTQAANATALFFNVWLHGGQTLIKERQFKTYAARLNKIGIDIRKAPDLSKHSPIIIRQAKEIVKSADIVLPEWYRHPNHLRIAA